VLVLPLFVNPRPSCGAELPNIVLIYADDLGYGDVGCYGATAVQTPHVDRLAAEGLRFEDGHAPSATCTPSRYAMLTGEYAWRKPGTGILAGDARLIIEPGRKTLPAMLRAAGYRTGVVGKWHLGLGDGQVDWNGTIAPGPLEIGFDSAFLIPATGDRVPCVYVEDHRVYQLDPADPIAVSFRDRVGQEPIGAEHPELLKMKFHHGHDRTIINGISRIGYMSGGRAARWVDEDMADVLTARATAYLEAHRHERFFLYFSSHDVHVPRVPHPRFVGRTAMGPRGDAIVQFDWCTGEILNALDRLGLTENTLVILSSDNGPVLNDGYYDDAVEKAGDHRPAGPLRGGKYSVFEAGTRVPFLVRWPGRVRPGVSSALVCQLDLLASLAALVGEPVDTREAPDSENVLAALLGESQVGRKTLVEHGGTLALRDGPWKLIPPKAGAAMNQNVRIESGLRPDVQLYDLREDLGETRNVAAAHPDRVREMSDRLQSIVGTP
jgi:arylsulfatase A-like enzyme